MHMHAQEYNNIYYSNLQGIYILSHMKDLGSKTAGGVASPLLECTVCQKPQHAVHDEGLGTP